jgi:poly(hydroxyalkanoate) depolymerase family esterase
MMSNPLRIGGRGVAKSARGLARRGARPRRAPPAARFETRTHEGRSYKRFIPSGHAAKRPLPLVVMLHGCGQDPDGFARDTRMNECAEAETFLVVYPEQSAAHNARRCWNWFDPAHQGRGAGEPAEIMGIVDAVAAELPVDRDRIYVAGLSAGAAMAVVLGATYPDRFAAIGVAAGLPYQAAEDCFGGLTLMQRIGDRLTAGEWYGPWQDYWLAYVMCWAASPSVPPSPRLRPLAHPRALGARVTDAMGEHRRIVPMILFQGTGDLTVKPANGDTLVAQWAQIGDRAPEPLGAAADGVTMTTEQGAVPAGRRYALTTYRDAQGDVLIRAYEVEGMGHSWSGGAAGPADEAASPLTDPLGPDATGLMWAFFQDHPMPGERRRARPTRPEGARVDRRRGAAARPARTSLERSAPGRWKHAVPLLSPAPLADGAAHADVDRIEARQDSGSGAERESESRANSPRPQAAGGRLRRGQAAAPAARRRSGA